MYPSSFHKPVSLDSVFEVIRSKDRIGIRDPRAHFSLVAAHTDIERVFRTLPDLLQQLTKLAGATVVVSGGHYGCANFDFRIQAENASDAVEVVKVLLQSPQFADQCKSASFDIVIARHHGSANEPNLSLVHALKDGPMKIDTLNITVDNNPTYFNGPVENSTIANRTQKLAVQYPERAPVTERIAELTELARYDRNISHLEMAKIFDSLDLMHKELAAANPRKDVFKGCLDTLHKCSGIAKNLIDLSKAAFDAGLLG